MAPHYLLKNKSLPVNPITGALVGLFVGWLVSAALMTFVADYEETGEYDFAGNPEQEMTTDSAITCVLIPWIGMSLLGGLLGFMGENAASIRKMLFSSPAERTASSLPPPSHISEEAQLAQSPGIL